MDFVAALKEKAKKAGKTIVLCEGEDKRVVEAAAKIVKEGIAKIILIGTKEECSRIAPGVDLSGVTLVDPASSDRTDAYAELLYKAREGKIN
ncbi:phosphate acyltransferase, partial [Treponema succinifaciens]